ncbi:MAG: hypothetical protein HQK77_13305 [Desulfobacterales bacterium]|nr:hypothetical protein [Desulfobacterales bacterium]
MYFNSAGQTNTDQTIQIAYERAKELGLSEVVVASSTGKTAYKVLETFKNFKIIVVTYHCGFNEPFQKVMDDATRNDLESKGVKVVSATHALSGVERSIAKKFNGLYPVLLIAETLRLFGQGTKVAVEISVMAADAGYLSGNDIVAIGGTAKGADTALIIKPSHQSNFFDLQVLEIICKPRCFKK